MVCWKTARYFLNAVISHRHQWLNLEVLWTCALGNTQHMLRHGQIEADSEHPELREQRKQKIWESTWANFIGLGDQITFTRNIATPCFWPRRTGFLVSCSLDRILEVLGAETPCQWPGYFQKKEAMMAGGHGFFKCFFSWMVNPVNPVNPNIGGFRPSKQHRFQRASACDSMVATSRLQMSEWNKLLQRKFDADFVRFMSCRLWSLISRSSLHDIVCVFMEYVYIYIYIIIYIHIHTDIDSVYIVYIFFNMAGAVFRASSSEATKTCATLAKSRLRFRWLQRKGQPFFPDM